MIGAIFGDIVGSIYEFQPIKSLSFPLFSEKSFFTDDTVLTIAIADFLIHNKSLMETLKSYALNFPNAGYGAYFMRWVRSKSSKPYNSWGNGAAMRISPVGYLCNSLDETLGLAQKVTEVTHNHPEGIKGAQAAASVIFLARNKFSKQKIRNYISETFRYDLSISLDALRRKYRFDASCQGTLPVALQAFFESNDFEHAIRLAISMGGDSDTLACITGGMAQAYYGISDSIKNYTFSKLPPEFIDIIKKFDKALLMV